MAGWCGVVLVPLGFLRDLLGNSRSFSFFILRRHRSPPAHGRAKLSDLNIQGQGQLLV